MKRLKPSPYVASVRPNENFEPKEHVAFGSIFLERNMSPANEEAASILKGSGMPDRADQGWIVVTGNDLMKAASTLLAAKAENLKPDEGFCGLKVTAPDFPEGLIDLYIEKDKICIGLSRNNVQDVLKWFRLNTESIGISVQDNTDSTARIAVMGPESRKLLHALGVENDQLRASGEHINLEILFEQVKICRSDFAGPYGFDLIIPIEPFNNILAVLCSWAVRLDLNLLPVGWDTLQKFKR